VENKEARVKESRKGIVNMKFESIKICCEKGVDRSSLDTTGVVLSVRKDEVDN
jgi:hypothetical protein